MEKWKKWWNKIQNTWLWYKNKFNQNRYAHLIINRPFCLLLFWKGGETSSTTSSLLVPTSSYWWYPEQLKWRANTGTLRIHHSTAVRHSWKSCSDVTRKVTTEHERNMHSLPQSFLMKASHATSRTNLKWSTAVNCTYFNQSTYFYRKRWIYTS